MIHRMMFFSLLFVLFSHQAAQAAGAACMMAKHQGQTLDYELVITKGHPVEAQEEAEARLREKGYGNYSPGGRYRNLDVIRGQNLTDLASARVVVIRSEFTDQRGKQRSVVGCGFHATSFEGALWDAIRDAQSFFWGWKPDRDGYEIVEKTSY
jgi:hypothetical protein